MAIDLSVDAASPIPLIAIEGALAPCLRELIAVEHVPSIQVSQLHDGRLYPIHGDVDLDHDHSFVFSLGGHSAGVATHWVEVEDGTKPTGIHRFVGISAGGGGRTSADFALMAAIAVVIARRERTLIQDWAFFFTDSLESDAELFLRKLRVKKPQDDILEATREFDRNLNRASPLSNG